MLSKLKGFKEFINESNVPNKKDAQHWRTFDLLMEVDFEWAWRNSPDETIDEMKKALVDLLGTGVRILEATAYGGGDIWEWETSVADIMDPAAEFGDDFRDAGFPHDFSGNASITFTLSQNLDSEGIEKLKRDIREDYTFNDICDGNFELTRSTGFREELLDLGFSDEDLDKIVDFIQTKKNK